LASSLDDIIVVIGHEADAVRAAIADLSVAVVLNQDAALGQSTSVIAGLRALAPATEAVMFLLGDQPGVDPDVIDALIAAWRETGAPVVAPRYTDRIGNPMLFDRSVFSELESLGGDTGARHVVRAYQNVGRLQLVSVGTSAPRDIDTDADYAALLASLAAPPSLPSSRERGAGR
jgi:molybdenum cofactor cytidylyltransferase